MDQDHEVLLRVRSFGPLRLSHHLFLTSLRITILIIVGTEVGVGNQMGTDEIDERGRVTIPKELREKMGLKPKARVRITAGKNGVKIEKAIELNDFMAELRGCIILKDDIDPLRLKEIWKTVPWFSLIVTSGHTISMALSPSITRSSDPSRPP
jgi:AbrB family looped-hinge helix DNA binding protein